MKHFELLTVINYPKSHGTIPNPNPCIESVTQSKLRSVGNMFKNSNTLMKKKGKVALSS